MAEDINVEITDETIEVSITAGATWDGVSGKPTPATENSFMIASSALAWVVKTLAQVKTILGLGSAAYTESSAYATSDHNHTGTYAPLAHNQSATTITADSFQTPVFANPLALDATSHKDFKPGLITGNTTVNLTNAVNGDGGVIELLIDAVGGYTVALGTMFVTKIGTGSIVATANKKNYVFWFCDNATGELTYSIQTV